LAIAAAGFSVVALDAHDAMVLDRRGVEVTATVKEV
jgi:hypothetical protein